ncbi:hypothetical protein DSL72_006481 [Monilinia vaccinii-corymbosi]|uniref:Uncharacterized protein n=1 Tax=Monilinia vaccinii-corymbosi TaxID=61207 RepID=A0A8A3PNZ6_9HELO|nr:hypothetical protein DSL72_006481 [Monilinia vaccinii-corymbosi]
MIQRLVFTATLALAFVFEVSATPCVSTGVLLSGQTACPASPEETPYLAGVLPTSIPHPHTTSTIYGTNTRTDELGSVVTETTILSTTICPFTATEGRATPSPSSGHFDSTTNTHMTTTGTKSAPKTYRTVTLSGERTPRAAESSSAAFSPQTSVPPTATTPPMHPTPTTFPPTYATPSFLTKPTSTLTNCTTSRNHTNPNIATQRPTEIFTYAAPSAYTPTGISDASAYTAFPDADSGVSRG